MRRLARRDSKFIRILRTTLRDSQTGVELTNHRTIWHRPDRTQLHENGTESGNKDHRDRLKNNDIRTTRDFLKLPDLTARHHVAFCRVNPLKVSPCLASVNISVAPVLRKFIARQDNLHAALDYLRRDLPI